MRPDPRPVVVVAAVALASIAIVAPPASAGTLYSCVDARGIVRYAAVPCAPGQAPMAIDRVAAPPATGEPEAAAAGPAPALTADEIRRIARQREGQPGMTREARPAARPRHHLPDPIGAPLLPRHDALTQMLPLPLGTPAPGTQGPLVVAPPLAASPLTGRSAPVADPATGRVLAPFGDRVVDPITGTLWQRAGSVYVDPSTGRVIPAP